jgi:protein required for attachment to host cells
MKRHWVLVADASQARVLESVGAELSVVRELDNAAGRARSQDLVSDEPGRIDKGGRGILSAMDPRTSPHEQQTILFANRLAKLLESAAAAGDYERLTLVAPPHLLGLLRKAISPVVRRRISAEIGKDLVHADLSALKKLVADLQDIRNVAG